MYNPHTTWQLTGLQPVRSNIETTVKGSTKNVDKEADLDSIHAAPDAYIAPTHVPSSTPDAIRRNLILLTPIIIGLSPLTHVGPSKTHISYPIVNSDPFP